MRMRSYQVSTLGVVVLWGFFYSAAAARAGDGIAAKYPGDQGIAGDPRVVFVETFDVAAVDDLSRRWDQLKNRGIMSLDDESPPGAGGGKSLLMAHVGGQGDGGHLYRRLERGYDKLHVRFYVRFDADCWPIHHFFHVGGYRPATAWPQGGAGTRPAGDERFSTGVEPFGKQWRWDYYSYWMEMRGSPPRGQFWGNSFVNNPALSVKRDAWTCLELMMKMNSPEGTDGEMALWIDGEMVSRLGPGFPRGKWVYDKFLPGEGGESVRWDAATQSADYRQVPAEGEPFEGFRWRSDKQLQINFLWVLLYITEAPPGHVSRVWFDNIVAAEEYIGPISDGFSGRR